MDASPRTETKNQKKERKRRVAHSENAGICKRRVNEKNRTKVPHRVQDREAQPTSVERGAYVPRVFNMGTVVVASHPEAHESVLS